MRQIHTQETPPRPHESAMTSPPPLSRRTALKAGVGSLISAVSLAGCIGQSHGSLTPNPPTQNLQSNGWQGPHHVDRHVTSAVSLAGQKKQIHAHLKADWFSHPKTPPKNAQKAGVTAQTLPIPSEFFGAGKVATTPNVSDLLGISNTILEQLFKRIAAQAIPHLKQAGFTNIHKVQDTTLSVTGGNTARYHRYDATYPYQQQTIAQNGTQYTIQSGSLPVELQSALWVANGLLVGAVGIHPNGPGNVTVATDGQTKTLDLGFTPKQDRQTLKQYITHVS